MEFAFAWGFIFYGLQIAAFIIILFISIVYFDRRYRRKKESGNETRDMHGFQPTAEVFIDPKDGKKYRVYYNPRTGEREYIEQG